MQQPADTKAEGHENKAGGDAGHAPHRQPVLLAVQAAVEPVDAAADDDHGMGQAGIECGRIADQGVEGKGQQQNLGASSASPAEWAGLLSASMRVRDETSDQGKRETSMSKIGVMVCGHGSRDRKRSPNSSRWPPASRQRLPQYPVDYGFLEFAKPDHPRRARPAARRGRHAHILAVPGMLFAAGHAKNDIPSVLNTYAAAARRSRIDYGRELGVDPKMLRAAGDRIEEAERRSPAAGSRASETLLMVVGRGASDPDANSNVAKVMRMLWEGMGFGWAEVAYSGVTFPLVGAGARTCGQARLPAHRRLPLFPVHRRAGQAHLRSPTEIAAAPSAISSSSRPPISTTIRWCSTPSSTGSSEMLAART